MTGWRSKKMVRWLGPYAPTDRHADDVTLAHIVDLRKHNEDLNKLVQTLQDKLLASDSREQFYARTISSMVKVETQLRKELKEKSDDTVPD